MTIRLDMCRAVGKAGNVLGDSLEAVRGFLRRQLAPAGGFRARDGHSDLYYTVFGLEASLALKVDFSPGPVDDYLAGFGAGESLDLVHLASLIRCRANMADLHGGPISGPTRDALVQHLLEYRAADGGFHTARGAARGSAYGSFLALGAYQDLQAGFTGGDAPVASVQALQMPDGGFSNEPALAASVTTATAAALCILHYLRRPVPEAAVHWLLDRAHPGGGFTALPFAGGAGIPDLLSTATALHALALLGALPASAREKHLDYLDSLWDPQGGFRGHWADEAVDCEYTYYGLLSLGHLAA
jgi:hypothetical protein